MRFYVFEILMSLVAILGCKYSEPLAAKLIQYARQSGQQKAERLVTPDKWNLIYFLNLNDRDSRLAAQYLIRRKPITKKDEVETVISLGEQSSTDQALIKNGYNVIKVTKELLLKQSGRLPMFIIVDKNENLQFIGAHKASINSKFKFFKNLSVYQELRRESNADLLPNLGGFVSTANLSFVEFLGVSFSRYKL
ncbi:MAG: hypothetical protein ACXWQQ_09030 [Pseudobdellovibrio sp.]